MINNRIAVFSHYDSKNIIDPYVIDYLKELKKYISDIIFVSDGNLSDFEQCKIKDLCLEIIAEKHSICNDFGSYKIGLQAFLKKYPEKLKDSDELLFVNDSCYLVGSLEETFINMSKKDDCDCWGLVDDYSSFKEGARYYIGSFFIAFRKEVFTQDFFVNFIKAIEKVEDRSQIIDKCEFGLSDLLIKNKKKLFAYYGFNKVSHYIADNHLEIANDIYEITGKNSYLRKRTILHKIINDVCNIHVYNHLHTNKYYVLLKMGFPLLKRRNLQYESFTRKRLMFLWQESLEFLRGKKSEKYILQIKNHFNRVGLKIKTKQIISNKFNYFLYLLMISRPFYVKDMVRNGKNIRIYKLLFIKITLSR